LVGRLGSELEDAMFKAQIVFVLGNASNGMMSNSPMNMGGGNSGGQGPMLGGGKGSTQVTIPKDVCILNLYQFC
jgi:hypothetical protein